MPPSGDPRTHDLAGNTRRVELELKVASARSRVAKPVQPPALQPSVSEHQYGRALRFARG